MLNFLRKNAQSVIIQVIVVVIAIVFVFWGVGANLKDNPNALAVVNGKEIAYRDFQQSYERAVENYKQQFGGQMPQGFLESIGLKEQVLDQLIQSELLRQGAEKIGVMISKEATQRKIQEMGVFNKNGRFDLVNYKTVLERNRLSPKAFEAGIQNDLAINRVADTIRSFANISVKEVQSWIDYTEQEIKLAYTVFRGENYISQVKVVEDELQAWYATNKHNYKSPPQNKSQYLFFSYAEDLKQVAVTEDDAQKYYQENSAAYNTAEQRRARHILFKVAVDERPDVRTVKKTEAEKVLAQIQSNGDFAQLAIQHSEDSSRSKGGDLGFFSRGKMVQPFEEAVFSLKKGEVSSLVETQFGYHIIKLEEIVPEKTQTFGEVREAVHKELEKKGGKAITFKRASTAYEDIIKAGSLAKYSAGSGHPVSKTDFFAQNNPPQDSVVRDRSFLQAVFALKKGELSSIVEIGTGYAIIFVDDIKESVIPELSVVRDRAVADFKKVKSVDLARTAAEDMLKMVKEKQDWPASPDRKESEYLKRLGTSASIPDQVRQDAFTHVGRAVFAEKILIVDNVFYVYQIIDSRQGKDMMDKNKRQDLEQQLLAVQNNKLMADWLGQLRKEAKIWTNAQMLK
jgi:peptidyl-prolyl cis-trans isomerase D